MPQHQTTFLDDTPIVLAPQGLLSALQALFAFQEGIQLRSRIPQTSSLSYHPVISGIGLLSMFGLPLFSPLLKRNVCVRVF
jgi:hypothetical protein